VVQKTLIDGRVYFDRTRDIAERAARDAEKKALIGKEKKAGEKKAEEKKKEDKKPEEKANPTQFSPRESASIGGAL
jgi:hypothetical protein